MLDDINTSINTQFTMFSSTFFLIIVYFAMHTSFIFKKLKDYSENCNWLVFYGIKGVFGQSNENGLLISKITDDFLKERHGLLNNDVLAMLFHCYH